MMIKITVRDVIKITKVKPWAICFDINDKHYLLKGCYEDEESSQILYERELNKCGKYNLTMLKGITGKEYVADEYIPRQKGRTIVYSNIDVDYFVYKLTKRGFFESYLNGEVKRRQQYIARKRAKIQKLREEIWRLEMEIKEWE